MKKLRVAVLADYREEGWPSMDLVAEMTVRSLQQDGRVEAELIRPPLPQPWRRILGKRGRNLDRLSGRFWHYPRTVAGRAGSFDVFHLTDHSYSQVVHALPAERCLVTCHDLDTFRCLLPENAEARPWWFRQMMRRTLEGMRKAAHVTCVSQATERDLRATGWIPAERLSVTPNGISEEYFSASSLAARKWREQWLSEQGIDDSSYLLHVGSTIARKRIEDLLRIFAQVAASEAAVRLVRVGAAFTQDQEKLAAELGIREKIHTATFLDRAYLQELYTHSALVLQPSSYEGFGLPVAEAQACGAVVVASRIPVLEEVGGTAAVFCEVGKVAEWAGQIASLLQLRRNNTVAWEERRQASRAQAAQFRWSKVANSLVYRYQYLAG